MNAKLPLIILLITIFLPCTTTKAQFYTIVDKRGINYEIVNSSDETTKCAEIETDTITTAWEEKIESTPKGNLKKDTTKTSRCIARKKHLDFDYHYPVFPDLTLNNLLHEIRKNGIRHEIVVLTQAILETGWFTSSVCRNKKNLFGLTNPRTGQYYEFDDWKDSVKAYYTKVQYKYKGGNYLLWLDELGYAEDKVYVLSLIRLLNQYFI